MARLIQTDCAPMPAALPHFWLSIALLIGAGGTAVDASERVHQYQVQVSPDAGRLTVIACFEGGTPRGLRAGDDDATALLVEPSLLDGPVSRRLAVDDGRIVIESPDVNACVRYGVDFGLAQQRRVRGVDRVGHNVLTSSGHWLWRPDPWDAEEDIEVTINLPPGVGVSTPWQARAQSPCCDQTPAQGSSAGRWLSFRVGPVAPTWPDRVAFGPLEEVPIELAGAELRVAVLRAETPADPGAVARWLGEAAQAVTTLYGRFPQANPQVIVVPTTAQAQAVPWGQVLRGGAPAVLFVIDPRHSAEEFRADWTAVHEFSHLLLPYVSRSEPWISEGFASYYQNILRARAGLIEESEAWLKLWSGFQRGMTATNGQSTLAGAASHMRHHNLMRVYWAGAAVALMADVELRLRTGNQQSLDTALDSLNRCCMAPEHRWSGRELFARLDDLTRSDVLTAIYDRESTATRFPDVASIYRALGIRVAGDRVTLNEEAPKSRIRRALTSTLTLPPPLAADTKPQTAP